MKIILEDTYTKIEIFHAIMEATTGEFGERVASLIAESTITVLKLNELKTEKNKLIINSALRDEDE